MPLAAKGAWQVTAGVLPGTAMKEYTARWVYDSVEYEEDGKHAKEVGYQPIFMRKLVLATAYYTQISNPAFVNWIRLEFIWY